VVNAQDMCGLPLVPTADAATNPSDFIADTDSGLPEDSRISLRADSASFATDSDSIAVEGNVKLVGQGARITGDSASYNAITGEFTVSQSTYSFETINARGNAEEIYLSKNGVAKLENVKYTTCPEDNEVWSLKAQEIKLDASTGKASAKHMSIWLKKVPVLYLPYATYPISKQRKSGFLIPELRTSNQRGLEITAPWYWNIAPNYDATITPRYMSRRGLMMGGEARMLTTGTEGLIAGNYLNNDEITQTDRYIWNIESQTAVTDDWRLAIDATGVSDDFYLNDFSTRWSTSSQIALNRSAALERYGDIWSIRMRFQQYDTIDEELTPQEQPYIRLPQLAATGDWQDGFLGANYRLETEGTYFKIDENSVEGLRVHLEPEVSYELSYRGIYITPKASLFHTSYALDNTLPGADQSLSVTSGVYSIDSGAIFERVSANGTTVTLEPRAQYIYVPFQQQDELPVFDTILPDTNLVQLFQPNRYLSYDRIGDTNQLNLGFTSRVFGARRGREILTAAFGTARYFTEQEVTLPGEVPRSSDSGDYLLQARVNLYDSWNLDAGYQWDASNSETAQGNIRLQVMPLEGTVVNAGYRYQRQSQLDQGDFSFGWAISQRWNILGRAVYSFEDKLFVDQFGGIEYETCCWGVRLIYRERVSRDIGENDTSIGIQFVLKGFTELGNSVRSQLESGILGYADL
jgi:LPS-assembly protein